MLLHIDVRLLCRDNFVTVGSEATIGANSPGGSNPLSVRASPPAAGPPSIRAGYMRVASARLGAALAHLGTSCGG
eukprot:8284473-Pyramimonas_sp.AAC.1